tara:strand:- start:80 stop:640 length:561 start_codon:yes stop_codon:yes gene_type:complete
MISKLNNAIFITGVSAAGKTTLANKLIFELRKNLYNVILLDGTDMYDNSILFPFNGHTLKDREQRANHHIRLVKWLSSQGILPIVAFIGQPLEIRKLWSSTLDDWKEIYLKCDIEECIRRDNKNLYNNEKNKDKKNSIIGIDDSFNEPQDSWLTIDTGQNSPSEVQTKVYSRLIDIDWLEYYKLDK